MRSNAAALSAWEAELAAMELARDGLRFFIREAWPHFEPKPLIHTFHLDAIADHLEAQFRGEIRNLVINIPPRFSKSSIASVCYPAWLWLQDPAFRMLTASYQADLAEEHADSMRTLIRSDFYKQLAVDDFGRPLFEIDQPGLKNTAAWFTNTAGGRRQSVGVGGGSTGKGGDLVIVDDPHNPAQALSTAERLRALRWWDRTITSRLNDAKTGRKLIIMQRLHHDDLTGHVEARSKLLGELGYEILMIPQRFEPKRRIFTVIGWTDPRTEEGELLAPERMGEKEVAAAEIEMGPIAFAGQHQQRPAPEGGTIYRYAWMTKHWEGIPARFDEMCTSWDCAFKDLETSSYVVGQVWGRVGGEVYLLDQIREHLDIDATCTAVEALAAKWPRARPIWVEDKANGPAVVSTLRKRVGGILPSSVGGDKIARAQATVPFWAAGNVHLPAANLAPWLSDFITEMTQFPQYTSDDQVDAQSQALIKLYKLNADEDERARAMRIAEAQAKDD